MPKKAVSLVEIETITDALLKAAGVGAKVCLRERLCCTVSLKPLGGLATPHVALASQIVTSADLAVQEAVLQCLLESGLQECAVDVEENTPSFRQFKPSDGAPTIFVDPIDGTLAYSIGCPGWEDVMARAGFPEILLEQTKLRTNPQLYGIVLGVSVPNSGIAAVCALPELGILFHALNDIAFCLSNVPTRCGQSEWQ